MRIEIGKVYKCGDTFVYIEGKSSKLRSWYLRYYIGIECDAKGNESKSTHIGRFSSYGEFSYTNPSALKFYLEDISKRETIKVGDSVFYKDEFEIPTRLNVGSAKQL